MRHNKIVQQIFTSQLSSFFHFPVAKPLVYSSQRGLSKKKDTPSNVAPETCRMGAFSIGRCAVTVNLIVAQRIASLVVGVAGVAFRGIDSAIFHTLDDAHMVAFPILFAIIVPVIENERIQLKCHSHQ